MKDVERGDVYEGTITRIEQFGVFVEVLPGKIGLAHTSKLGDDYKEIISNAKIGDKMKVEVIGLGDGKIQLKKFGVDIKKVDHRRPRDTRPRDSRSRNSSRRNKE